jgi:hypothetical protein
MLGIMILRNPLSATDATWTMVATAHGISQGYKHISCHYSSNANWLNCKTLFICGERRRKKSRHAGRVGTQFPQNCKLVDSSACGRHFKPLMKWTWFWLGQMVTAVRWTPIVWAADICHSQSGAPGFARANNKVATNLIPSVALLCLIIDLIWNKAQS